MDSKQFSSISDSVTMCLSKGKPESENKAFKVNDNDRNIGFEQDGNEATNEGGFSEVDICVKGEVMKMPEKKVKKIFLV